MMAFDSPSLSVEPALLEWGETPSLSLPWTEFVFSCGLVYPHGTIVTTDALCLLLTQWTAQVQKILDDFNLWKPFLFVCKNPCGPHVEVPQENS